MPVTFARLRIAGFKSFAEPVSVEILPGLTGIVGPNGCGKSNVVEALRWCMGESSARSLRGGEMDDLIFAGTAGRAARNLAEVVLTLEDAAGLAPPPLHDQAELQINRRIERGAGSSYRINGREARARDVQTLFADLASGARSSAMVSQGRVAAIVGARPEERRSVLEEAAGITGLHARRHEAELKLRATESNLARAEDLRLQLETQARSLSGQAEQAARYRTVAEELRGKEASLLALLHARANRAVQLSGAARIEATQARIAAEAASIEAEATEQHAAAALTAPREAEALSRTLLERRRIEAEGAARETERAREESDAAERRMVQARDTCEAAERRREDADGEVEHLRAERAALADAQRSLPERLRAAAGELETARAAIGQAERVHRDNDAAASDARTRVAEHRRDAGAAADRLARSTATLAEIDAEREEAMHALPDKALLLSLDAALAAARDALSDADARLDAALSARTSAERVVEAARLGAEDARRRHQAARKGAEDANSRAQRLRAECGTLRARLADAEGKLVPADEQRRARDAVADAERALAAAANQLETAHTLRNAATASRLEAETHRRDGARTRAQAEAEQNRTRAAFERAAGERTQAKRDHDAAVAAQLGDGVLSAATTARMGAETALADRQDAIEAVERSHAVAQELVEQQSETLNRLRDATSRLSAGADGLSQALSAGVDPDAPAPAWSSLGEMLEVPAGLELAVAAVLADGLDAACVPDAPQSWLSLPALSAKALPAGATPLSTLIGAPVELDRALQQAGLLDTDADGDAMQQALAPGQCLATRTGALWRWDGFRVRAGKPSPASVRLQQRARHRDTLLQLEDANRSLPPAVELLDRAQADRDASAERLQRLRAERIAAEQELAKARDEENRLSLADAQNRVRLESLEPRLARAETVLADAETARNEAAAVLEALPAQDALGTAATEAARAETVALEEEQTCRRRRAAADAALQDARAQEAALSARHATHDTARRSLQPALARAHEELDAAVHALADAQAALEGSSPVEALRAADAAGATAAAAEMAETDARVARDRARSSLADRTTQRDAVAAGLRDAETRLAALDARRAAATIEHEAAGNAAATLDGVARTLPDAEAAAEAARGSEEAVREARDAERTASDAHAALLGEEAALAGRRATSDAALSDWNRRLHIARTEADETGRAYAAAREDAQKRQLDPDREAARGDAIATALSRAQDEHDAAVRALQDAETAAHATRERRRQAETGVTTAREALVRAEGREEQAREILARLLAETPDPPHEVPADLSDGAENSLRRRIATLVREREAMGPVNLRAELELSDATARMEAIAREREEIETAIARLRGQIGQLNREGRERLLAVFEQVDRHFQSLFARMFNGGRAHLGMVGSDDPLEAGLEIYAQPPGKKLATLSLLSGGEQALTALSLVFAVFRCNPAPICVLDEVDAPLDDANVERFCTLLGDMVREAGTRFLVVTHHQLTMAHMDRLYGVTMQERGVSRVLSVDLAAASAMMD